MIFRGEYKCSKSCELCEGVGRVFDGLEAYINSSFEQDVRDTTSPCINAEWIEPDYQDRKDDYDL